MSSSIIVFSYRNFRIGALYTYFSRIKEKKIQDASFAGKKPPLVLMPIDIFPRRKKERKKYIYAVIQRFFSSQLNDRL